MVEPRPGGVAAHPPDWHLTLFRHLLDGSERGDALALVVRAGLVGNAAPFFTVSANDWVALRRAIVT